jgi:hypothetical protein
MSDHFSSAWDALVEQKIRQAQAEGQFDNLPGMGKPLEGLDDPSDELWWIRKKLRRENLSALPPALAIRLEVHQAIQRIQGLGDEAAVRAEIAELNEKIRKANRAATWGPPSSTPMLDVAEVVAWWNARR